MTLWHMRSKVLNGFYQSEVIVEGDTRSEAINNALNGYDGWLALTLDQQGYHPLISSSYPEDEDHKAESSLKRAEFHREAQAILAELDSPFLIMVAS